MCGEKVQVLNIARVQAFLNQNLMRAKYGFLKEVQLHLGKVKASQSLISAVRKGIRHNDAIMAAINEVGKKYA